MKNFLLTGAPGCGKTTVILRLIDLLPDLRWAGFYTRELRSDGMRVGFEVVGLSSGLRAVLAHVHSPSRIRVGRYGVEPEKLEPVVKAELEKGPADADVYLIDEIGKMELHCPAFTAAVPRLLAGPLPVVATVGWKGPGLIAEAKARTDIRLIQVSTQNRDDLPAELAKWLREVIESPGSR